MLYSPLFTAYNHHHHLVAMTTVAMDPNTSNSVPTHPSVANNPFLALVQLFAGLIMAKLILFCNLAAKVSFHIVLSPLCKIIVLSKCRNRIRLILYNMNA